MNEETIFTQALQITDLARRQAYLAEACAGNTSLRRKVEALLKGDEDTRLLERPAAKQMGPSAPPLTEALPAAGMGTQARDRPPAGSPEETRAEPVQSEVEELRLLAPSERAGSLGRLGSYEILEVIGKGGFGTVFRALDEKLHRVVAIKILVPQLASNGTARKRFLREAAAAAAVVHEHVVTIHAIDEAGGIPFIVMQLVAGVSLEDKLRQTGPLQVKEILRIGMQIAEGLAAAHRQGLIHRDIKPANILLENGVDRVKITDFGLARAVDDGSVTQSGVIAGTPMFMAPEQAAGETLDLRADLFSLGSVLYVMCTGRPPFRADSTMGVLRRVMDETPRPIREINPDIPDWLVAVVEKLHAKRPADRIQTAQEVAELLARHLAEVQLHGVASDAPRRLPPAPVGAPGPVASTTPQRRSLRTLAAVVAILAVLGVAGVWMATTGSWPWSSREHNPPRNGKLTDEELAARPSPLDTWKRQDIPSPALTLWGRGDPSRVPAELIGVLGDPRFRIWGAGSWPAYSPNGKLLAVPSGEDAALFDVETGVCLRAFHGHTGRVYRTAFTPDGNTLVTASWDRTVRLWEVATGRVVRVFTGHRDEVHALAVSLDGKWIASGSKDREIKVWAVADGEVRYTLTAHTAPLRSVAFSSDGKLLVSACSRHEGGPQDENIRVWDLETGKQRRALPLPGKHSFVAAAFSPDDKYLAACTADATGSTLKVWDVSLFAVVYAISTPADWLAFTPDGSELVTATHWNAAAERQATIWQTVSGKRLRELRLPAGPRGDWVSFALRPDGGTLAAIGESDKQIGFSDVATGSPREFGAGHTQESASVAFSPDGRTLASAGLDHLVILWDLKDGKTIHKLTGHTDWVRCVVFSPDGKKLATCSWDKTVRLWDPVAGRPLRILDGHSNRVDKLAFSPDGKQLASCSWDGTVKVWDVEGNAEAITLKGHTEACWSVAFSPDGRTVVSGSVDGTARVWDLASEETRKVLRVGTSISALTFLPDGKTLVVSDESGAVTLWSTQNWSRRGSLPGTGRGFFTLAASPTARYLVGAGRGHLACLWDLEASPPRRKQYEFVSGSNDWMHGVAFSPEGRHWASTTPNGTVCLFRLPETFPDNEPDEIRRYEGHTAGVESVAVSPDSRRLLSAGVDRDIRLWDIESAREVTRFQGHSDRVEKVVFSANGRRALSSSVDKTARLWDVETSQELSKFEHPAAVTGVDLSPDGRLALTGCYDQLVRLWNVDTGKELRKFKGHTHIIIRVRFSPDGRRALSTCEDGTVRVWDVDSGKEVCKFSKHGFPVRDAAFSPDGKHVLSAGLDQTLRLWEVDGGKELRRIEVGAFLHSVMFSADGKRALTASGDWTVRLWDVKTAQELGRVTAGGGVTSAVFAPDERHAFSSGADRTVRLWRLPSSPGEK